MMNRKKEEYSLSVKMRMAMIGMITALFIVLGSGFWIAGYGNVYADVGSIADGEDISYDKEGGVLKSMGFDTSKMPETYDPDATTNPYGSDVSNLNEVNELVLFDFYGKQDVNLYGHNNKLNGKYGDFLDSKRSKNAGFLDHTFFVNAVKCDITGDGRDSALAVVYTKYNGAYGCTQFTLYMCLYDPVSGKQSDPFEIGQFRDDPRRLQYGYDIQSQLQITAGDYDKDSIDEIAVYSPAKDLSQRNTIQFYDLIDGKDCKDPFNKNSWQHSWNYMLPNTSEKVIITIPGGGDDGFAENCYNNIDLTSGDADNDGICDLIVSYGASNTNFWRETEDDVNHISRSIPSRSVLLYGRDDGQMLRDSQPISYGGQSLIRVSFAFGDIDSDGNEDMFFAGQLQSEQADNISRTLGRYVYDSDAGEMSLESIQNLKVVDGTWGQANDNDSSGGNDTFYSSNGWDGTYYSVPLMTTNLAVGKIFGDDSDTKIYLDSVLYSYEGGNYQIEDELEDDSKEKDGSYKGSCVFAGDKAMMNSNMGRRAQYYEFGAKCANFTAAASDCVMVNRVGIHATQEGTFSMLYLDKNKLARKDPINGGWENKGRPVENDHYGATLVGVVADTDIDGLVAEYTGEHDIQYQNPSILAVLASPPYFRDVVAYDDNNLLVYLNTEYGTSSGTANGEEHTFECTLGGFVNTKFGTSKIYALAGINMGWARAETWGWEKERTFEMSYITEGGEDAVAMYSIPTENYVYKVHGVTVDDDGTCEQFTNTMVITKPHKPVTQTLTLEDYNEIQKRYPDKLPDVTKYLTSTPGDPSSYPTSEKDLSAEALSHIDHKTEHPVDVAEKWAGTSFGVGSITQSITYSKTDRDRYDNVMNGFYGSYQGGAGSEEDVWIFYGIEGGVDYEFTWMGGDTLASIEGSDCSGTLKNMPRSAKGYGYGFSWKLLKYNIKDKGCTFPVVTYIVNDVTSPPELPETIEQDFDKTTDSQIALTWTYNKGNPQAFDIYRYEDFPVGGGDKLIASVDGSDYKILKDEDGNTLRDQDGHVIRSYSFIDKDLTADTKYEYRMKVRTAKLPGESIFSPVVEARTDVGTKPDLLLSTDELTIYPDNAFNVKAILADPENYQKDMSFQWQQYDAKKRVWEDIEGCNKQVLHFYNCAEKDAGTYRCRVNLIRKVESSPQYISAFTESCKVGYSLRSVKFGPIEVFDGTGSSRTNTGISVNLSNTSEASTEKPTGVVIFNITGPNGSFDVAAKVNEETGDARVSSVEDLIQDLGQQAFVDGGYVITASYEGSGIFYPAKDTEEYHYLRNINESMFLSLKSTYYFGEDIAETAGLFDYKVGAGGRVTRTDLTDKITQLRFYQLNENGDPGDEVAVYDLTEEGAKAPVPLNKKLAGKAYVEAYMAGTDTPVAASVIKTRKIPLQLTVKDKTTGTGEHCSFLTSGDVELTGGIDPEVKNIETDNGKKSLSDFMLFSYYVQSGDFICDSDNTAGNVDQFVPASYHARVQLREAENGDDALWFYTPTYKSGRFMVVGNFYLVSAGPADKSTGSVRMLSPEDKTDFTDEGFVGGTKIILKAEPNTGYEINKWIIDDCGNKTYVSGTEKLTFTVRSQSTDGSGRVVITAEMKPKNNRISIAAQGSGQVQVSPAIVSGENVLAGTKLKFTAVPDAGWHFAQWHWAELGGSSIVSDGTANEDGSNTKEFTMPDSSVEVHALFARDTVDVLASEGLEVLYENNGGDPYHDVGELVKSEKGKNVPKGSTVLVRTKAGVDIANDAAWTVSVAGENGPADVTVTETMSQGRSACRFTLPEDAVSCSVSAETEQGKFTVDAETDGVQFTISVDGQEMEGTTVDGIASGSQVDITAKVNDRGKRVSGWIINGETKKTTDTLYRCNITENMSIAVTTEPVDAYSLKISAEGGGVLKYVVRSETGEVLDTQYVGENDHSYEAAVYLGESVLFTGSEENEEFTLTSISLNGVKQTLSEGTFKIDSIDGDAEILARFGSNKYCNAVFSSNLRSEGALLLDHNDNEIKDGEELTVPKNRDLTFSLILADGVSGFVDVNGELIEAYESAGYGDGLTRYRYKAENITSDISIRVSDHDVRYIGTGSELKSYMDELSAALAAERPYEQPDGVLTANIDMSGVSVSPVSNMYARFDGNGYTISDLSIGTNDERQDNFRGIFGTVHEDAYIRDVTFEGITAYGVSDSGGDGLLTQRNYGTISGVTITDSLFDLRLDPYSHTVREELTAGLAYENLGLIEHCMVSNLTINTNLQDFLSGSAGVKYNKFSADSGPEASIKGNFFEYLYRAGKNTTEPALGLHDIVALRNETHYGSFESNYYRQLYATDDTNGINVYSFSETPDDEEAAEAELQTAEFDRKLAYIMNKDLGEKVWGVTGNTDDDKGIYLLSRKDGSYVAPIKVEFVLGKTITRYCAPCEIVLPGAEVFGDDTPDPDAWMAGDKAYTPGSVIKVDDDIKIVGIYDLSEYVASLSDVISGKPANTVYYKDIDKAISDAAQKGASAKQQLDIIRDAAPTAETLEIPSGTTITVKDGATLKISRNTQVNNDGTIIVEAGATVHKYGSMLNKGSVNISNGSTFINYGSAFAGNGSVTGRENITCRPHILKTSTTKPTCTEKGVKTQTCMACLAITTEEIDALGHDFAEDETTAVEPTCESPGKKADQKCSRCSEVIAGEEIPALKHDWDVWVVTKDATEDEEGTEVRTCKRDPSHTQERSVPVLPHVHAADQHYEQLDPTCTADGNIEYWTCKCGRYFSDADCTAEINIEDTVIDALGHNYETVEGSAVKPGCETAGKEADKKCSGCDSVIEGNTLPALGHEWSDWAVAKEATTTEDGIEQRTCSRCGAEETRPIPKKGEPAPAPAPTPDPTPAPTPDPKKDEDKKPDTKNQMGEDGTPVGRGASAKAAEKAITGMKSDSDLEGSSFTKLRFRSTKQGKYSIQLKWTKVNKAVTYVIYGNKCGKGIKPVKLAEASGNTKTITKIGKKKLEKGTYYKFVMVALDKDNKVVTSSKLIHVATKGGKVGNHKSVTVKSSVVMAAKRLRTGKSLKLKAKANPQSSKLKVRKHVAIRYASTKTKVATVTGNGTIKAKGKGTCYIYAYAQNGAYKKIKVVVK